MCGLRGYSFHSEEGSAVFGVWRAHQDPFSPSLFSDSAKVFAATSSTKVEMMALAKSVHWIREAKGERFIFILTPSALSPTGLSVPSSLLSRWSRILWLPSTSKPPKSSKSLLFTYRSCRCASGFARDLLSQRSQYAFLTRTPRVIRLQTATTITKCSAAFAFVDSQDNLRLRFLRSRIGLSVINFCQLCEVEPEAPAHLECISAFEIQKLLLIFCHG